MDSEFSIKFAPFNYPWVELKAEGFKIFSEMVLIAKG